MELSIRAKRRRNVRVIELSRFRAPAASAVAVLVRRSAVHQCRAVIFRRTGSASSAGKNYAPCTHSAPPVWNHHDAAAGAAADAPTRHVQRARGAVGQRGVVTRCRCQDGHHGRRPHTRTWSARRRHRRLKHPTNTAALQEIKPRVLKCLFWCFV